ncbi:hypothetical protein MIND_00792300 [Mycena indigotica]|uniref:Spindle pole body component n=1 Tax=Mycena indigotica TaxID=2126181 RepID=A0A8H6W589_9AGAR|nr:uncharacterized protein MIND_00792300 [Mycena indigotica]KAF7302253.1 hypothetical protein MIND_00792300 [Mycena indigotica]
MLPSSSSGLSVNSNISQPRPLSALSQRPHSSASRRALSRADQRPLSSLSNRPVSRVSQRPHSRHARSRLLPICQSLVIQLTGLREDDDGFHNAVEYAIKSLESTTITKAATSVDMSTIDKQVHGHVQKARITSRDTLAEAFETCYERLKERAMKDNDLDQEIQRSRLPDHMRFLMSLSSSSTSSTLAFADAYLEGINNPPMPPPAPTWAELFGSDEPEASGSGSGNSSPSLSPLSDEFDSYDEDTYSSLDDEEDQALDNPPIANSQPNKPPHTYNHRKEFEQLKSRQYWRDDYVWTGDAKGKNFDLGDASTLGPALRRVVADEQGALNSLELIHEKYIDEQDAVREFLIALQGRKNVMLSLIDGTYKETTSTPRLVHLSAISQSSLTSDIARVATTLHHLRAFVTFVLQLSYPAHSRIKSPRMARTMEAFADAVDAELRMLDHWCAEEEQAICWIRTGQAAPNTKLVISLLSMQKSLHDKFVDGFDVLLSVIQVIAVYEFRQYALLPRTPAVLSALLLDTLLEKVQLYREQDSQVLAGMLMRVFVTTAEPIWAMVGRWLRDGMGLGGRPSDVLDEEFFIEGSGLTVTIPGIGGGGLLDPDFWADGYILRDGVAGGGSDNDDEAFDANIKAVPSFLDHVAPQILGSGKAVGLLRALGFPPGADGLFVIHQWRSFGALLASGGQTNVASLSADALARLIYEELQPHCHTSGTVLGQVLIKECELLYHLAALEDLYFMRRGDAMTHFTDVLFVKMDAQQAWNDFHFLNSAFRDVIEASKGKEWVQSFLVRLSYRGGQNNNRSVTVFNNLVVEYAVPFPVAYIFPPRVLQVYGEVFVFLLQFRRAKSLLERILVRGAKVGSEMKAFYAFRGRLSWFINTMLNFLTTQVIHAQVTDFHKAFARTKSLDEMVEAHSKHVGNVHRLCLLGAQTAALHRAIISILDIALHFCNIFTSTTGNTTVTLDVSRHSLVSRRHHSRRQRARRKNVVSFSRQDGDLSSDESDQSEEDIDLEDEGQAATSFSVDELETGFGQVDKLSSELDGLVRFVRRGVESLASGGGDASASFSVLAFALEDWDL